ncbi:MAG: hypothetical protein AT709_05715 [Caldivirga sp. MG_3]|nr:MAG: hypothetical protein AT709_05715 [Caldivirga sp. MG_3]
MGGQTSPFMAGCPTMWVSGVRFINLGFMLRLVPRGCPPPGELSRHGERGLTSPAMPGEGIYEVKPTNRRTNVVRLLPNGSQERRLRRLANISARLFNELNYERRQQFFNHQRVDFRGTWGKYYGKYKGCLVLMLKP